VPHESVALNAALGSAMVRNQPEEVGPALRRGLEQVRRGTPALIPAYLPTLVDELSLATRK
jgi:hypothetical protein